MVCAKVVHDRYKRPPKVVALLVILSSPYICWRAHEDDIQSYLASIFDGSL